MPNSNKAELTPSIGQHIVVNIGGNGFRVLVSFSAAILSARSLGSTGFGQSSLITAATIILCYIPTLGFDSSLSVLMARALHTCDPASRSLRVLQTAFVSAAVSGVISCLGSVSFLLTLARTDQSLEPFFWSTLFMILHSGIFIHGNVLSGALRANKIFSPVILRDQVVFPAATLASQWLLLHEMNLGLFGFGLSYLIAAIAAYVSVLPASIKMYRQMKVAAPATVRPILQEVKRDLFFSLPLGIMATLEPLYIWISVLIAGRFATVESVGQFNISLRLAVIAQFFANAIGPVSIPYMATYLAETDFVSARSLFHKTLSLTLNWSLLAFIAATLLYREFFNLFGSANGNYHPLFLVTMTGIMFDAMFAPVRFTLLALGRNKINAILYSVALALNCLLVLVVGSRFGILGCAFSFSFSLICLNLARVAVLGKSLEMGFISRSDCRSVFCALLIFLVCTWLDTLKNPVIANVFVKLGILCLVSLLLFLPLMRYYLPVVRARLQAS